MRRRSAGAPETRYELRLTPQEMLVRSFVGRDSVSPELVPSTRIAAATKVVLAIVADGERYTVFLDQREIARFTDARTPARFSAPVLGFSGLGTARLTAARFYELP